MAQDFPLSHLQDRRNHWPGCSRLRVPTNRRRCPTRCPRLWRTSPSDASNSTLIWDPRPGNFFSILSSTTCEETTTTTTEKNTQLVYLLYNLLLQYLSICSLIYNVLHFRCYTYFYAVYTDNHCRYSSAICVKHKQWNCFLLISSLN